MPEATLEDAIEALCQAARAKANTADAEGRVEVRGEDVFGVLMQQGADRDHARGLAHVALTRVGGLDVSPEPYQSKGLGGGRGPWRRKVHQEYAYLVPLSACDD